MAAALEHFALSKNIDDVGVLDRGQTMRDGDGRPSLRYPFKRSLDELLALWFALLASTPNSHEVSPKE